MARPIVQLPSAQPGLDPPPAHVRPLNACELEIDLFCCGVRIDASCALHQDGRAVSRTRAGLGSGLELVLPGPLKDVWVNVPVEEDFARVSPYLLVKGGDQRYYLIDDRSGWSYPVHVPPEPEWYSRETTAGTPMRRVGVLQGTYLGIYISNSCLFWYSDPSLHCRFCTTGANVGVNEIALKSVEDVVEVCRAAKEESGVTFVHFNSGYSKRCHDDAAPFVEAVKKDVGALVGLQLMPTRDLSQYDRLIDLGVDHFSFCYEFHNQDYFSRYLPGKEAALGQRVFFDAMEYTARRLGKGAVSGEIIAGVEPVEDTLRAIDYITGVGAFPTVCVFRPVIGSDMERFPPPRYEDMRQVFEHVYHACRRNGIPIGVAPNIEVSLVCQPDDTRYLAPGGFRSWLYERRLGLMRRLAKPLFERRLRQRPAAAAAARASTPC